MAGSFTRSRYSRRPRRTTPNNADRITGLGTPLAPAGHHGRMVADLGLLGAAPGLDGLVSRSSLLRGGDGGEARVGVGDSTMGTGTVSGFETAAAGLVGAGSAVVAV